MSPDKFLTKEWNNWLTLGLGLPMVIYSMFIIFSSTISDFWGFIGIFVFGAVY